VSRQSETEHGAAVGHDRHGVALDRVLVGLAGVLGDRGADAGDARRVRHREVVAGAQRVLVVLLDLAADVHQERAVGGVDHLRAVDPLDGRDHRIAVLLAGRVDRDVAHRVRVVDRDQVDEADRRPGLTDRTRHAAQHPGPVGDPDAQYEGELSTRRSRHDPHHATAAVGIEPPPCVAAAVGSTTSA
jgi:hypothetical protein